MSLKRYDFSTEAEPFHQAATVSDWGNKLLQIGLHQVVEGGRVECSRFAYASLEEENELREYLNKRHAERQPANLPPKEPEGWRDKYTNLEGQTVNLYGHPIGKDACPVLD